VREAVYALPQCRQGKQPVHGDEVCCSDSGVSEGSASSLFSSNLSVDHFDEAVYDEASVLRGGPPKTAAVLVPVNLRPALAVLSGFLSGHGIRQLRDSPIEEQISRLQGNHFGALLVDLPTLSTLEGDGSSKRRSGVGRKDKRMESADISLPQSRERKEQQLLIRDDGAATLSLLSSPSSSSHHFIRTPSSIVARQNLADHLAEVKRRMGWCKFFPEALVAYGVAIAAAYLPIGLQVFLHRHSLAQVRV
jgi:hypothetical protein